MFLLQEAQKCRQSAQELSGKPEAFLLEIADALEELAQLNRQLPKAPHHPNVDPTTIHSDWRSDVTRLSTIHSCAGLTSLGS